MSSISSVLGSGLFGLGSGPESLEAFCSRMTLTRTFSPGDLLRLEQDWNLISATTEKISALERSKIIGILCQNNHENLVTTLMKKEFVALSSGLRESPRGSGNDIPATYLLSMAIDAFMNTDSSMMGRTRWEKNAFMVNNWLKDPEILSCVMSPEEALEITRQLASAFRSDDGIKAVEAISKFKSHPSILALSVEPEIALTL